jgi:hypothetical protein
MYSELTQLTTLCLANKTWFLTQQQKTIPSTCHSIDDCTWHTCKKRSWAHRHYGFGFAWNTQCRGDIVDKRRMCDQRSPMLPNHLIYRPPSWSAPDSSCSFVDFVPWSRSMDKWNRTNSFAVAVVKFSRHLPDDIDKKIDTKAANRSCTSQTRVSRSCRIEQIDQFNWHARKSSSFHSFIRTIQVQTNERSRDRSNKTNH